MLRRNRYAALDRQLTGESESRERPELEPKLEPGSDPRERETLRWMAELRDAAKQVDEPWSVDGQWSELRSKLSLDDRHTTGPRFTMTRTPSWRSRFGQAALLAAALLLAVLVWRLLPPRLAVVPQAVASDRIYRTHLGERALFTLPDGSRIVLGPGSRLDAAAFDSGVRVVSLSGRAFFTIATDSSRPFRIRTGAVTTEVLGTQFDVRAYEDDKAIAVAVLEGSVAVSVGERTTGRDSALRSATVLRSGDLARVDAAGRIRTTHPTQLGRYLAWTEGRLEFVNVRLDTVLPELARWYDLDFRISDSALAALPFTATFSSESATDVLRILEASLGIRVERRGRSVTLARSANP